MNKEFMSHEQANEEVIRQSTPPAYREHLFVRDQQESGKQSLQGNTGYATLGGYGGQRDEYGNPGQNPQYGNQSQQAYQGNQQSGYQNNQQAGYVQGMVNQTSGYATTGYQRSGFDYQQPGYQQSQGQDSASKNQEWLDRLPKVYNKAIVAVKKDGRGNLLGFKTEDGNVLNYTEMLNAGLDGAFSGLRIQANREGELIIRSVPDGFTDNNLDNLPGF